MSGTDNTPSSRKQNAVPTNLIVYRGRKIPARIDPAARIGYIIEIMSDSFSTAEHHITLCLRDQTDALVTQSALAAKVESKEDLKLVPSPVTEALSVVTSLKVACTNETSETVALGDGGTTPIPLKLALFNLQKYVKEEEFAVEFMLRGGMSDLVLLLQRTEHTLSGNSLAYALQGIRGLLEFEAAWNDLSDSSIDRFLALLVSAPQPNVLRPATAIIRKLVISTSLFDGKSKGKGKAKASDDSDIPLTPRSKHRFGFDRVWARMQSVTLSQEGPNGAMGALKVISKRLEGAGDLELVAQSLGLINAFLRSAHQERSRNYPKLIAVLELLNVRRYVLRLMPTCASNIVEPHILNFQSRFAAILNHRRLKPIRPETYSEQERMLGEIWHLGKLTSEESGTEVVEGPGKVRRRTIDGWQRIGLGTDRDVEGEGEIMEDKLFTQVGELGLECLHWFVTHEESFHNLVIEEEAKPQDKRCPLGRASAECVKILCEHYKVNQAGPSPSQFQPFLLHFSRLNALVLKFFLRMWTDSESRLPDFDRVAFLVRSQVRLTLSDEAAKTWLHLERDFLEADYRSIRDKQMETMEREDGLLSRPSVKELKERLSKEAYDVLSEQRVRCMTQGAWFNSCAVIVSGIISSQKANPEKPLRFVRLSPNRRTLAWGDFSHRPSPPPSFESLRERVDLSNMTDIRSQTGCPVNTRSPNLISKLSFSLMSGTELSLLNLDAVHAAQLAEWTDGIRVLSEEGRMVTKETANYVHILTELALKVRLLDITGDGVDLPEKVSHGLPPHSVDFWFAK